MEDKYLRNQASGMPAWVTGLAYISALLAGASLITLGRATPAEASGYVAPFLVVYERMLQRRRWAVHLPTAAQGRPTGHRTTPFRRENRW
jgi:hypothetical protein